MNNLPAAGKAIGASIATALILVSLLVIGARGALAPRGAAARALEVVPLAAFDSPAPSLDAVEVAWSEAPPLRLGLTTGGPDGVSLPVELRAVYSATRLYLWLHWPDDLQAVPNTTEQQRATVTWRRDVAIGGCAVACHTSFSQGRQITQVQLVAPDGGATFPDLLVGQWKDGWWTLGYARPLTTQSPVDAQFDNLTRSYAFGLDVTDGTGSVHTQGEELQLRFRAPPRDRHVAQTRQEDHSSTTNWG